MERILVIDDDVLMLDVVREMLEQEGYTVTTASSGEEGLRLFAENPTDVLITDIIMPHKDGVSVISEVKSDFPQARIIAISGTPKLETFEAAVGAAVNRVIAKPFSLDELLDAVAQLIDDAAPVASK